MRILQEREFELWERRTYTEFDSPMIGLSDTSETSRVSRGSFKAKTAAKKAEKKLINKYIKAGWEISKESAWCHTILFMGASDLIIWTEEKVVSEKPFRAR